MKDTNRPSLFTSNFKQVLLLFLKLCIILIFVIALCLNTMPQYLEDYSASLLDKTALLKKTEGPKIVLVGNSNLAFGIDSAMIEDSLGMPVVNMGFHGGCGNAFHEEMAKINVCEGDIYVLCHTDYIDEGIVNPVVMWTALENHFELWKLLRLKDIPAMIKAYPAYLKYCIGYWINEDGNLSNGDDYARRSFNAYGDIGTIRRGSHFTFSAGDADCPQIDDATVKRINKLNLYLRDRGAVLVVAGYPIGKGEFTASEQEFVRFQDQLREQLDCEVISDFRNYMFDYSYFYNTSLHLNTEGAQLRTAQLISDLTAYLEH